MESIIGKPVTNTFEINYLEFLDEIESEDQELEAQTIKAESEIEQDEKDLQVESIKFTKEINTAPNNSLLNKYQREIKIKRMALDQKLFDLNRRIPNEEFKKLIELLTQKHTDIIKKYSAYINKRVTNLLLKKLPSQVRWCWKYKPNCMKAFSGFPYTVEDHNMKVDFWVTPNIPAFYDNPEEVPKMLRESYPRMTTFLDKAVLKYGAYKRKKWELEAKIANTLVRNNIKTYFDLLKFRPFMFEIIFNYYTKNGTCSYKIKGL